MYKQAFLFQNSSRICIHLKNFIVIVRLLVSAACINPFVTEATIVKGTRTQKI